MLLPRIELFDTNSCGIFYLNSYILKKKKKKKDVFEEIGSKMSDNSIPS